MNADALRRELLALLPRLRRYAYALTGVRHDADSLSSPCQNLVVPAMLRCKSKHYVKLSKILALTAGFPCMC